MTYTSNGTHHDDTPPAPTAYTQEQIDCLTDLGVALTWEDLDAEDRLDCCLANPHVDEWLDTQALETFADFRTIPTQWARIKAGYRRLGGDMRLLEEAVQGVRDTRRTMERPPHPLGEAIVSYAELQALDLPKRETFLDWLSERALVMIYGPRGVGKTMALLGLAVSLTTGKPFLKWPVRRTTGVLYVEGEMAVDELRDRAKLMAGGVEPACLAFLPSELAYSRLDRDLTLISAAVRLEIEDVLQARPALRILVLDNISCLFPGISENNKQDWEPINAWLIRLRHRGVTVILGHHAGKNGQQRGTSSREDPLNTVLALSYPPGYRQEEGCHFFLRFEKSRGVKGSDVEGLDVRFDETPDGPGWTHQALETVRTERLKLMLADGVPPRIIAEELGISTSYVYRQKRYLGL